MFSQNETARSSVRIQRNPVVVWRVPRVGDTKRDDPRIERLEIHRNVSLQCRHLVLHWCHRVHGFEEDTILCLTSRTGLPRRVAVHDRYSNHGVFAKGEHNRLI